MAGAFAPVQASSHREAPFLTKAPKVDGTDFYMFRSYAPGREGFVTMIANFIPFQDPQGGPNFYQFDENALYEIHVDNNGDAKEHITFQLRFKNTSKRTALPDAMFSRMPRAASRSKPSAALVSAKW